MVIKTATATLQDTQTEFSLRMDTLDDTRKQLDAIRTVQQRLNEELSRRIAASRDAPVELEAPEEPEELEELEEESSDNDSQ